jgi:sugar (pentulose or hexulose) kinase
MKKFRRPKCLDLQNLNFYTPSNTNEHLFMKTQYLMAIDVGGDSGRCLLLDPETGATRSAKRNWTHPVAPGTSGLGYSIDTNDVLKKLADASREVLAKAGAAPHQIAGIATSGMRNTIVVLDPQNNILLATPNRDARALGGGMMLDKEGRLWSGQHVVPGQFILESNGMVTGDVLDWFARLLYPDSPDATLSLFAEAAESLPGAANIGLLPARNRTKRSLCSFPKTNGLPLRRRNQRS